MSEATNTSAADEVQPEAVRRRRGTGTVERLPSGSYRAALPGSDRDGRRRVFDTEAEALAWLDGCVAATKADPGPFVRGRRFKPLQLSAVNDRLPFHLVTLREAAEMTGLSELRLYELAEAGYAPHWRVDGGPPVFRRKSLLRWVRDNVLEHCPGRPFPAPFVLAIDQRCTTPEGVPLVLAAVSPLFGPPPAPRALGSGVYFLCDGEEVVYVGESGEVYARVPQHVADKTFDRWYWMPVPETDRLAVETGFIQTLRPKYNRRGTVQPCQTPA